MVLSSRACVSKTLTAVFFAVVFLTKPAFLASQDSAIPLKDVCPAGWTRYECSGVIRLCTSPDLHTGVGMESYCTISKRIVPDEWIHDTAYDVGFAKANAGGGYRTGTGYGWFTGVWKIDSSSVSSDDDMRAILHRITPIGIEDEKGNSDYRQWRATVPDEVEEWTKHSIPIASLHLGSLEEYGLHRPKPPSDNDVCPADWGRYSCALMRLCVSPGVMHRYAVTMSENFKYAECRSDSNIVPAEWTGATPHDVGYARGALLVGPRYLNTVKMDSSDIVNGDIDEAIQRLVLVPATARVYVEFLRGEGEGIAEFEEFLAKNRKKAQEVQQK
jgi:hypothetical protein